VILGWDISTAIIGFAAMEDHGGLIRTAYCDLRKVEGLLEKGDEAVKFVGRMANDWKTGLPSLKTVHFVEDRLAGFSGGGSNAGTVMRLAAFNAMVCWFIHEEWRNSPNSQIVMMHPSTVKAALKHDGLLIPKGADKKALTLEFVSKRESENFKIDLNRNEKPQPYCYDMADACITAWAGIRKFPELCK
jgi:hypothetical protein